MKLPYILLSLLTAASLNAATYVWTGANSSDWADTANWEQDSSTPATTVPLASQTNNTITIGNGMTVTADDTSIGSRDNAWAYIRNWEIRIGTGSTLTLNSYYLALQNSHIYVDGDRGFNWGGTKSFSQSGSAANGMHFHLGANGSLQVSGGKVGGLDNQTPFINFYADLDIMTEGNIQVIDRVLAYGWDYGSSNAAFYSNATFDLSGYDSFTQKTSGDLETSDGVGAWQTSIKNGNLVLSYVTGDANPIPEPASFTFALCGLAGLLIRRKRS